MRVLIVEDDNLSVHVMTEIIATGGFEYDRAATGEVGLRKITSHPYDAAIVDIKLIGKMSGLDLIKTAREKA